MGRDTYVRIMPRFDVMSAELREVRGSAPPTSYGLCVLIKLWRFVRVYLHNWAIREELSGVHTVFLNTCSRIEIYGQVFYLVNSGVVFVEVMVRIMRCVAGLSGP